MHHIFILNDWVWYFIGRLSLHGIISWYGQTQWTLAFTDCFEVHFMLHGHGRHVKIPLIMISAGSIPYEFWCWNEGCMPRQAMPMQQGWGARNCASWCSSRPTASLRCIDMNTWKHSERASLLFTAMPPTRVGVNTTWSDRCQFFGHKTWIQEQLILFYFRRLAMKNPLCNLAIPRSSQHPFPYSLEPHSAKLWWWNFPNDKKILLILHPTHSVNCIHHWLKAHEFAKGIYCLQHECFRVCLLSGKWEWKINV